MSLNVNKVWLKTDDAEVQVSVKDVKDGDNVIIRMGNVIPFMELLSVVRLWLIRLHLQENLSL